MSFEEGFAAIAQVKASGEKLGETIKRITALEGWLTELRETQTGAKDTFASASTAIDLLREEAGSLAQSQKVIAKEVEMLPVAIEQVLVTAEERLAQQLAEQERMLARFPAMVEEAVEKKLTAILSQMEARFNERLRDELKDTRTTLRETLEYSASRTEIRLEELKKEIVAELPRGLFGRRKG
ncbi:hypothetical protein [Kalamiella sp. sgz302252]|uniref:hypothetical protein n=1 Tax=Pantoea sp. sgz302252 TaxID=3341827 RepID=UPI0036D2341A